MTNERFLLQFRQLISLKHSQKTVFVDDAQLNCRWDSR